MLFGDLVSFTTWSEDRDPEEVRELLSTYFTLARTVVARYGGTVEKFIGDAVMAVWGVPTSHEDDTERAVRAGLDLVEAIVALGPEVGAPDLSMRVGVVTGSVAVTLGAVHEGMVAGDAVNTAARVQSVAQPGEVWTDALTRSMTATAITYSDAGTHALKGKAEAIQLFRAEGVATWLAGQQRLDGLEASLVGRGADLRRVKETFHAGDEDGRPRLLLVEGLAGLGKSRLVREFAAYVDGLSDTVQWYEGRCLSYGGGAAYWAFADMIRRRIGVTEDDDVSDVRRKIEASVRDVSRDESEVAWLAPRLMTLMGTEDEAASFDRTDLFSAWSGFLERVGRTNPLVLVFEDMQHVDSSLLDLVVHLLENCRARLYLLLVARPELRETHASLLGGSRTSLLQLEPLVDEEMTELVDALVGELPPAVRKAIVTRSEGVPLFAVELVRSLIDRDAVMPVDGRYVFVDTEGTRVDFGVLATPTSVQALITARLDALPQPERRVAQEASVIGLTFRPDALGALSGATAAEVGLALDGLTRRGVVEPQRDSRSPDAGSYRFVQALVREVAYGTLSRRDRKALHLAAAEHIAGVGDTPEALAGIVGQHLLDALDAAGNQDGDRPEIVHRAAAMLRTALARAEALGSPEEALRCCLSALALEPSPEDEADLLERAGRAALNAGDYTRAIDLAHQAESCYASRDDEVCVARTISVQAQAMLRAGRTEESIRLLRPVFEQLKTRRDVDPVLREVAGALAMAYRGSEDPRRIECAFALLAAAERSGEPTAVVDALNGMAVVLVDAGSSTASTALTTRSIEIARQHGMVWQLGRATVILMNDVIPRDIRHAREVASESISICQRAGDSFLAELAVINAGYTWWLSGEWSLLTRTADEWLADHADVPSAAAVALPRAWVAAAQGRDVATATFPTTDIAYDHNCAVLLAALRGPTGDPDVARQVFASMRRTFQGGVSDDFEVLWAPAVEVQLQAGELEAAAALIDTPPELQARARGLLNQAQRARLTGLLKIARGEDPSDELRAAERDFEAYGAPYYLARTRVELGRWLLANAGSGEAASMLAQARTQFELLGAQAMLDDLDLVEGAVVLASRHGSA